MKTSSFLANAAAGLTFAVLAGCGGGGGGGGVSAVVYSGNTSPAVVTTMNASTITANVMGSDEAASIIGGASPESGNSTQIQGTGPADLATRLGRVFRDIALRTSVTDSKQQVVTAAVPINETDFCEGAGTIRIFGTLNDDLTGTVMFDFSDCLISGITLNGSGSMRIDVFLSDFTMSFERLTLRGAGLSIDAGGSIRFQEFGNTLTITMNLVEQNNNTGKMRKTVNLVIVDVYNNINFPTSFTQTLAGQVYHSDFGYVDVTTMTAFFFATLDQLFPNSGQIRLTGATGVAGNRTILVTAVTAPPAALPATLATLELDLDGDGVVDNTATLKWTDLTGPVGSNLADDDGDLMHNSWETFYGLNPDVDDANDNKDGDSQTNIQEYMAGTTP